MDVMTAEERHRTMAAIRGKDTKPEIFVRHLLWRHGLRYRKNVGALPGRPDIYLPRYNTAIFVNGCFWHAHEGCRFFKVPDSNRDFWMEKFRCNRARDERTRKLLEEKGIRQLVVWECTVKEMMRSVGRCDEVLASILNFLNGDVQHLEL